MTSQAKAPIVFDQSLLVDGQYIDSGDVKLPLTDAQNAVYTAGQYVSVSSSDTHIKHLDDAIANGTNITKTIINPSANASIRFDLSLASPGIIGNTTPAAGTFTTLTLNQTVSATPILNITGTTTTTGSLISATGLVDQPSSGSALIAAQAAFAPNANLGFLYGILFIPRLQSSSNTVSNMYGIFARVDTAASFSGTISSAVAIRVATPSKAGGTITAAYGLFVETQNAGGTNFGIYSNDNVYIIGSRNAVQLAARANGTQTANIAEFQNSGGTVLSGVDPSGRFIQFTQSGAPSGAATAGTMVWDSTNSKLYVYTGAAWKGVVLT